MPASTILVNRAPVLTLWAAVVAGRLGYDRDEALTLGKAVAGLNAQSKGRRLGIFEERAPDKSKSARKSEAAPPETVALLRRVIPVVKTRDGLRAVVKGRAESAASVQRYLEQKFGEQLTEVEAAMRALANAHAPKRLAEIGFALYEDFRPSIPPGVKGWGAKGRLDLERIRCLAEER